MTGEKTAIVGAGLSGLAAAVLLREQGLAPQVFEARDRAGGRIHSVYDNGLYVADLGPTWVWPPFQPGVARWLEKLGLETTPQYNEGRAVLDYGPGQDLQLRALPGQDGQVRVVGGPQALIDACVSRLSPEMIRYNTAVHELHATRGGIQLRFGSAKETALFDRVIVAAPPRIAAAHIQWEPTLPQSVLRGLQALPTWMAPHAKVVAVFDAPFWRQRGLSGRIASQVGPIVEAHDHCGPDGSPAALFGFLGISAAARADMTTGELRAAVRAQLVRCFGDDSPSPKALHIEDWSREANTTTPQDLVEPMMHPEPGPQILREAHYDGRVRFAGAEIAQRSAGLIDGALVAAEHAVRD